MNICVEKAKMEIDDVVDLSLGFNRDSITEATVRDLRSLTQNAELTITPASTQLYSCELQNSSHQSSQEQQNDDQKVQRRVLRPRTEPKSYAEAPDIVLLPARTNGRQHNGNIDSETDDEEMPLCFPIKELSPAELKERERSLRKLRDDLRNEETKLVLLKKLKQSQHVMKENLVVTSTCTSATSPFSPTPELHSSKGLTHPLPTTCAPYLTNAKTRSIVNNHRNLPPVCTRANETLLPPPRSSLPGGATLTAGRSVSFTRTSSNLTITPSVTITPTSGIKPRNLNISDNSKLSGAINSSSVTSGPASAQQNIDNKSERSLTKEEVQSPAQKQAAAKLALRKQLEKTLLQIPPPKPPPPEMHFVPNPSNSEFVYLLGLETVVDYLMTKEKHISTVLPAFCCVQCKTDFTPVWKWEKQGNKDAKVICEQCVTTNVKKALKVEHTNRLKQAFVKALQQEQEIEQRLSTQNRQSPVDSLASNLTTSVLPSSVIMSTKCQRSQTPTTRPTPPPSNQPTPPPIPPATQRPLRQHHETRPNTPTSNQINQHIQVQQHKQQIPFEKYSSTAAAASAAQLNALSNVPNLNSVSNIGNLGHNLGILGNSASSASSTATAAAMQAFHQQIFRVLGQGLANNPQHLMQFTPLLYSYHQMALAQAAQAAAGKNSPSLADIQRAAEMQRQFLMDMIPPQAPGPSNNRQNNWKN